MRMDAEGPMSTSWPLAGMFGPDGLEASRLRSCSFPELQNFLYAAAQLATVQLVAVHPSEVVTIIWHRCTIAGCLGPLQFQVGTICILLMVYQQVVKDNTKSVEAWKP